MIKRLAIIGCIALFVSSCLSTKRISYLKQLENVEINDEGYIETLKTPYYFQNGDVIHVNIYGIDESITEIFGTLLAGKNSQWGITAEYLYFNGLSIDKNGEIELPLLGIIKVEGFDEEQVEKKIETELFKYFDKEKSPIFVKVKQAGIRFTTIGEVTRTGIFTVYRDNFSILEALAQVGGVKELGDMRKIRILRDYPEGQRIYQVDITDAKLINSGFYYIKPNDIIIVDPLPHKSIGVGTRLLPTISQTLGAIAGAFVSYNIINSNL